MKATTISISIPENLLKQINQFCEIHERTKSYLVKKALEKYLQESLNEKLENEMLAKIGDQAYQEYLASGKAGTSYKKK